MGLVTPVRPDAERISYLVRHLRDRDREEIYATRWDNNPESLAADVRGQAGEMAVIWELDGIPAAIQGALPIRPGVWVIWCFGTSSWRHVLLSMTRHARRYIMPALLGAGFHRAEAHALSSHSDARAWIESLGGSLEGIQRGAGRGGEDFVTYVWNRDDVQRRLIR